MNTRKLAFVGAERAIVLHAGDWLRVRPLPPGLHVLTHRDVNDVNDRRLAHALAWLVANPAPGRVELLTLSGRGDKDLAEVLGE